MPSAQRLVAITLLVHGCAASPGDGGDDGSTGVATTTTGSSADAGPTSPTSAAPSTAGSADPTTSAAESSSTGDGSSGSGEDESSGGPEGHTIVVAVGNWGHRGTTSDGVRWTEVMNEPPPDMNDHTPDLLRGVGYGDGKFVAVGGDANGMVMTTTDGVSWDEDLFPAGTDWLGDVAWLDGIWVAVGGNGVVVRSTDGGVTWEENEERLAAAGRTIIAAEGTFVAAGDGGSIAVSTDGLEWNETTDPSGLGFTLAHGLDTFVGFASQWNGSGFDTACIASGDALAWSPCALSSASFGTPAVGEGAIVVRIDGGWAATTDGSQWDTFDQEFPDQLVYADGLWVGLSWQRRWYANTYAGPWESFEDPDGFRDITAGVVYE